MKYLLAVIIIFVSGFFLLIKESKEADIYLPSYEIIEVNQTAKITCYNDSGTMANGEQTFVGAVAVSDRSIPLNSHIYVEGYGIMKVADRTAKWIWETKGMVIDIYDPNCDRSFGVKRKSYTLIK